MFRSYLSTCIVFQWYFNHILNEAYGIFFRKNYKQFFSLNETARCNMQSVAIVKFVTTKKFRY